MIKKTLLVASLAIAAVTLSCKNNQNKPEAVATDSTAVAKDSTMTTAYACPMHPEVTGDQPGQCPKCGMDLEIKNQ